MGRPLGVDGVEHLLGQPRHELPAHRPDRVAPPLRQERRPRVILPLRLHRITSLLSLPLPPSRPRVGSSRARAGEPPLSSALSLSLSLLSLSPLPAIRDRVVVFLLFLASGRKAGCRATVACCGRADCGAAGTPS